ncbi:ketol-acid reductoisomerase [Halarsenatibacter silvermanii]|uniref:Ketol-acid reductoisomerase (NADP(+)) n=1 Tax=Halarsenatibacter silvermanii TaxID=321763 RepID=A0A1G9QSV7_9FIRM|nr:ketol-acid reductoisomerase [Halarsenatibacter silvermanii]SDM14102.1 ketol-acid reductoisomerase [Halarsenatibacter silvermanii]
MTKVFYNEDADLNLLSERKVAIIGYGSQGHAQAQNLCDSGVDVIVGLRQGGESYQQADEDGFDPRPIAEAAEAADIVQILLPDTVQKQVYEEKIADNLESGNALVFSHGFNIHYRQIVPPEDVDVYMVAPKAPGHLLRRVFEDDQGVPALIAVFQDSTGQARDLALAQAKGIGSTRAGVLKTTFAEETESDLFGEQAVLCGGVTELIRAGFETLVDNGYSPEIAYFECLNELKLIVDLIYEQGITGMRESISDTAEYGDLVAGEDIINEKSREAMENLLEDVQNGEFAKRWLLENRVGRPSYIQRRENQRDHQIEKVGRKLRSMMEWQGD